MPTADSASAVSGAIPSSANVVRTNYLSKIVDPILAVEA
jgi:hypothetical protein